MPLWKHPRSVQPVDNTFPVFRSPGTDWNVSKAPGAWRGRLLAPVNFGAPAGWIVRGSCSQKYTETAGWDSSRARCRRCRRCLRILAISRSAAPDEAALPTYFSVPRALLPSVSCRISVHEGEIRSEREADRKGGCFGGTTLEHRVHQSDTRYWWKNFRTCALE